MGWRLAGIYIPIDRRIEIRNLLNGQGKSIPTTIKTGINWSPNSESVLYLDNISTKGYYFPRIFRFDINDEIIIPITYGSQYNEYAPEWSPDAYLIAFIRQDLINEGADINDQIWLMDSNGDNQKPVTHDEDTIHGAPNWSPDGKYLLFPYFSRKDNISKIGYINIQTGDFYHVITGKSPAWNP